MTPVDQAEYGDSGWHTPKRFFVHLSSVADEIVDDSIPAVAVTLDRGIETPPPTLAGKGCRDGARPAG